MTVAHFWIRRTRDNGPGWAAVPLTGRSYQFVDAEPYARRADGTAAIVGGAMVLHIDDEAADQWILIAAPGAGLRVNGREALLGALPLRDRDEIRLPDGQRLYFATERLPEVVVLPKAAQKTICPRCCDPIEQGTPAVNCPCCGIWCHQRNDRPCWHYEGASTCPRCSQSNAPDAGYRWWPDGL